MIEIETPASPGSGQSRPAEPRWLVLGRPAVALVVAILLASLGVANIVTHDKWREVEDGVLWGARPEGVVAVEVARGSAGALAGIERGDLLLAIAGAPVQSQADVIEHQHRAQTGTRVTYTLIRLGTQRVIEVALAAAPSGSSMYYVLATVGLFTLLVGASVRLKRPHDQGTLHFFWLCVAFFGAFTFSFNGPFDRLDWVFYWGGRGCAGAATAAAAALHPCLSRAPRRRASRVG